MRLLASCLVVIGRQLKAQVDYVDPAIGGLGFLLEPTRPTVSLPNSLVRVYPVRSDHTDDFDGSLIQTEFTPTERCGYFRFMFPSGKPVVLLANRLDGKLQVKGPAAIAGGERFQNMRVHVRSEFNNTPVEIKGDHLRRMVIKTLAEQRTLEFRYTISLISVE